jgi:hypothetical protein
VTSKPTPAKRRTRPAQRGKGLVRKRLSKLEPIHYAAIRLKIEGRRPPQIAEELDVALHTVHIWFSEPLVKDEVQKQLERVNEIFAERLASASLSGLEVLLEIAQVPRDPDMPVSDALRMEAAMEILDRYPLTRKQGNGQGNTLNVNVSGMSDMQLLQRARELSGLTVDGDAKEVE